MAIGFMSFGGMLTGGEEEEETTPVAEVAPVEMTKEASDELVSTTNEKE